MPTVQLQRLATRRKRGLPFVLGLACIAFLTGACTFFSDWDDDHTVLNDLVILDESQDWLLTSESPAVEVNCSWDCPRVTRVLGYTVNGDFDAARSSVLEQLEKDWSIEDDLPDGHFLMYDGEIATSTGDAFLWAAFNESAATFSLVVSSAKSG